MIRLINKELFDKRSYVSTNYDWNLIIPIIELVQFKYIKKILGSDLFEAIQAKVLAYEQSATAIAADYKTLLDDYILPCLIWHIKAEMAMSAKFRIKPGGIFEANPDNNTPINTEDLKWFVDECRNNAEAYGQEMIGYLTEHSTSFTEYSSNSGLDKTPPTGSAYSSPFYTKGKKIPNPYECDE